MSSPITLEEAQVLRELAEAERETAQAEKYREEAAVARVERELKKQAVLRARADTRYAEANAQTMRVTADQVLRQERVALAQDHFHHTILFNVGVDEDAVDACVTQLNLWHRLDSTCPMHFLINSPGGSVIDGMHLFDEITRYSLREWDTSDRPKGTHKTTMTVRGWAASMAGILLQSADHRVIGPEATLMIHEISSLAAGKVGEIKDEVKFLDKLSDHVVNIFVRRSGGKMTPAKFKKLWDRQEWYLDAEEAYSYGFVDAIG